jgi:hypothetical protein
MAGLVPAMHVFLTGGGDEDAGDEPAHDEFADVPNHCNDQMK